MRPPGLRPRRRAVITAAGRHFLWGFLGNRSAHLPFTALIDHPHIPVSHIDPLQNFIDRRYTLRKIMPNNPERLVFVDGHAVAFHSWFTSYPNSVILVSLIC